MASRHASDPRHVIIREGWKETKQTRQIEVYHPKIQQAGISKRKQKTQIVPRTPSTAIVLCQ